jgi:hypothetical protein
MPFKVVSGAGVGAAAVVVGLSLAGPQALGVASADSAATDSTSVSAGPAEPSAVSGNESSPSRPVAGRGGRGVKSSGSTVSRVGPRASVDVTSARVARGSASVKDPAVTSSRQRPSASSTRAQSAASGQSFNPAAAESIEVGQAEADVLLDAPEVTAVPLAVLGAADGAVEPARAQRGAAVRVRAGTPIDSSQEALVVLHNLFDTARTWVETLPGGPVTDFLAGALLLTRRTLFPNGDAVGNVTANLPTEPPPGFDTGTNMWYQSTPTLRGTAGAPLLGSYWQTGHPFRYQDDGVQGMITNKTNEPIVVRASQSCGFSRFCTTEDKRPPQAILLPNDWMPYQLDESGYLSFFAYDGYSAIPDPTGKSVAEIYFRDPFLLFEQPSAQFFVQLDGPRNWAETGPMYFIDKDRPVWTGGRRYYDESEAHVESYGGFSFWVRREHDGWYVRTSQAYLDRYGNPNVPETRDWAIFNINVNFMA